MLVFQYTYVATVHARNGSILTRSSYIKDPNPDQSTNQCPIPSYPACAHGDCPRSVSKDQPQPDMDCPQVILCHNAARIQGVGPLGCGLPASRV